MARTIGLENKIGLSRIDCLLGLMRTHATIHGFPEIAVRTEKLVAILWPPDFSQRRPKLCACFVHLPIYMTIILDVIELQKHWLAFAAAVACASVGSNHFSFQ
ncbi:hypothetical protein [Burkholderia ubonensis]|uniref:hypothetical protein n=1 Tax=Burkholderia ubonensis TaxID=101571 RepID=UPI0018DF6A97|nr:hypothetical protein [Burkholderia ubonensis]